jgi:hypothetical protein
VCQASDAHFTRTGNSWTPAKTASLPSSADAVAAFEGSAVTRSWKRSKSVFASATVFPLRASVIIDAEAVEIEQPEPSKLTSRTTSPSTRRDTVTRSPHSGLWPFARRFASGIPWKFRGRLVWSRITSW